MPNKYKVSITLSELLELESAVNLYLDNYEEFFIGDNPELELYRIADIHKLLYSWIKPKITSLERDNRVQGSYSLPLTHTLSLWTILQELLISRQLSRDFLSQLDKIVKGVWPSKKHTGDAECNITLSQIRACG